MNGFRKQRIRAGFTQVQAAASVGVIQPTVSAWETGNALPKPLTLQALAALYGCSIEALLETEDSTTEKEG